ncbi:hypothetical protein BGX26_008770, partial [Mortierella sp. AD094]
GWSGDGKTLPGALDLEYGPNGNTCWGVSPAATVTFIHDFSNTNKTKTGRPPVIYTTTYWWQQCIGNSGDFSENPLWTARYASSVVPLPARWPFQSFWQITDNSGVGGD